jgi:hypothetical protein
MKSVVRRRIKTHIIDLITAVCQNIKVTCIPTSMIEIKSFLPILQ